MKNLYLLILFLTLTTQASAQIEYSVNVGLSRSDYDIKGDFKFGSQHANRFIIGIALNHKMTDLLSLNGEFQINYLDESFRGEYLESLYLYPIENNSFFQIGKMSALNTNIISELDFKVLQLLSIGVGINTEVTLWQHIRPHTINFEPFPSENQIAPLSLGLSTKVKLVLKSYYLQIRYLYGLTNEATFYVYNDAIRTEVKIRERVLQLSLGYTF